MFEPPITETNKRVRRRVGALKYESPSSTKEAITYPSTKEIVNQYKEQLTEEDYKQLINKVEVWK